MVNVGDPVGRGIIASFARPGGNVTGSTTQNNDPGVCSTHETDRVPSIFTRGQICGLFPLALHPTLSTLVGSTYDGNSANNRCNSGGRLDSPYFRPARPLRWSCHSPRKASKPEVDAAR
jgi:hypothetical protein